MQDLHTSQKKIIIFIEENFLIRLNFGQNTQTKFNLKTEDKNKMEKQNDIKNQEKTEKPELTKDMLVSTLVAFYPELTEPLMLMGMHCISCFASQMETLEEAAMVHGLNADEVIEDLKDFLHQAEIQNENK